MKIAISADGDSVESKIDQRFGRCKYFIIAETEENEIVNSKTVENEGAIQGHGAGIKAAEQVAELQVEKVITGSLGPNATEILKKLEIKSYHAEGNVRDAIIKCIKGELSEITEIAESHSGDKTEELKKSPDERIFFPLLDNKGMDSEISPHFGHAPFFGLYDMDSKKLTITTNELDHTNADKSPVDQVVEAVNPTTVFALGIGARAKQLFNEKGVSLKTGNYKTVREAIDNLEDLDLQTESCGHENHDE